MSAAKYERSGYNERGWGGQCRRVAGAMVLVAIITGGAIAPVCADTLASTDTLSGLSEFTQGEYAEAMQDWRDAADQGDANGALYVGTMYDTGIGVHENYAQALQWYRRAAALGSAAATFNVGVMYDAGKSVAADPEQAASWYAKAAKLGYARADYNLALLYQDGVGVRRDRGRAAALFRAAARLGLGAARQHLIAMGYGFTGPAVPPVDTAVQEFDDAQAALLGRSAAGTTRAVQLFRAAAQQGNTMAQYDLGYCYESGIGVPVSKLEAYVWYSVAAAQARDPQMQAVAYGGVIDIEHQLTPAELRQAKTAIAAAAPVKVAASPAAAAGK